MLIWYENLKHVAIQQYFDQNYKISRSLGSGAFATVYKCTRLADNKEFAVKVFDKSVINKSSRSQLYKVISKQLISI